MTVKPGVDWGQIVPVPADGLELVSDADIAEAIDRGETRALLVRGGDLFRTVGAPPSSPSSSSAVRLSIDALRVTADGVDSTAVGHVVVRRSGRFGWWRGPIVCVMNAEYVGRSDVAPRAHPNDGRFDLVSVAAGMSVRSRWQAWRRLATGTHVPHPDIATRRGRQESFTFDRPLGLWVDGVRRGTVRSLTVSVVSDAAVIYV